MVEGQSIRRNSRNSTQSSFSNSSLSHREIASAHKLATRKMYLIVLISLVLLVGIVLLLFYVNDNVAGQAYSPDQQVSQEVYQRNNRILSGEVNCNDGIDNDNDNKPDCFDSDCPKSGAECFLSFMDEYYGACSLTSDLEAFLDLGMNDGCFLYDDVVAFTDNLILNK